MLNDLKDLINELSLNISFWLLPHFRFNGSLRRPPARACLRRCAAHDSRAERRRAFLILSARADTQRVLDPRRTESPRPQPDLGHPGYVATHGRTKPSVPWCRRASLRPARTCRRAQPYMPPALPAARLSNTTYATTACTAAAFASHPPSPDTRSRGHPCPVPGAPRVPRATGTPPAARL
jgi:hypothetical protein